jgi:hypothetical protein
MSSAKPAAGAEGEVLAKLTKAARHLLQQVNRDAPQTLISNKKFYHLTDMALLELAAAVREAEKIVEQP